MEHPHHVLGIFAKTPRPGQVKTRLSPPLSPEQASAFYALSLDETIKRALQGPWRTLLFYSDAPDYFHARYPTLPLAPQQGENLGARMSHALGTLLATGAEAAALIGSDSPDLPEEQLHDAFAALKQHAAVVAPSHDGGYVLIGEREHHPELFRDIAWSTPQVLDATRTRAEQHAISLHELSPWEDVDDEASLKRLIQRSPASACARLARKWLT